MASEPPASGHRKAVPPPLAGFTTEPPNLLNSFGGAARERRIEASRAQRRFGSPSLKTQACGGSLTSRAGKQTGTGYGPPSPVLGTGGGQICGGV